MIRIYRIEIGVGTQTSTRVHIHANNHIFILIQNCAETNIDQIPFLVSAYSIFFNTTKNVPFFNLFMVDHDHRDIIVEG